MKEPSTVTLSTEEMILELVRSLDEKVDELSEGQADIKAQIAAHEERSLNQGKRIERVEKITGGISLAVIVAVMSIVLSGCGLFSNLVPPPAAPIAPASPKVDVVKRAVQNTVALQTEDGQTFCSGVAATTMTFTHTLMTVTGDGGGNTLATITGAGPGQILTLLFVDALVTITDTAAHTADTVDLSAAFTSADDTVLQIIYDGTSWYEVSRSVN